MGKRKLNKEEGREHYKGVKHPRKCFYRSRAHSNPLNDAHFPVPLHPDDVNWHEHFPSFLPSGGSENGSTALDVTSANSPAVEFADVGCGYGGLLVRLSPLFPDKLMLGMELRDKIAGYVVERTAALRRQHPGFYGNVSCVRTNAMKYLLHYFRKGQLSKLFFLFPDPHFKASNHRRRIINRSLLDEYAYCLRPGGRLYTATDVEDLAIWMREKCCAHPLFQQLDEDEVAADPAAQLLTEATEEGQKVARNQGQTWKCVFVRIPAPKTPAIVEQDVAAGSVDVAGVDAEGGTRGVGEVQEAGTALEAEGEDEGQVQEADKAPEAEA